MSDDVRTRPLSRRARWLRLAIARGWDVDPLLLAEVLLRKEPALLEKWPVEQLQPRRSVVAKVC